MFDAKGLISSFIEPWRNSRFANIHQAPWDFVGNIEALLRQQIAGLDPSYQRVDEVAVHRTARLEPGAVVRGPASSGLIASSLLPLICGAECISNGIA